MPTYVYENVYIGIIYIEKLITQQNNLLGNYLIFINRELIK